MSDIENGMQVRLNWTVTLASSHKCLAESGPGSAKLMNLLARAETESKLGRARMQHLLANTENERWIISDWAAACTVMCDTVVGSRLNRGTSVTPLMG